MTWDRFDICMAYWTFAYSFHEGQGSETYAIFGRLDTLRFSPGACATGEPRQLNLNARAIYQKLVERHCGIRNRATKGQSCC